MTIFEPPVRAGRSTPARFAIAVQPDRALVRVRPAGELDIATADRLRQQLTELLEAGFDHVVIDLRELVFIDASGLHVLLTAHADAQRDGWRLSLLHGPAEIRRIFELTGTIETLPFEPDHRPPVTP